MLGGKGAVCEDGVCGQCFGGLVGTLKWGVPLGIGEEFGVVGVEGGGMHGSGGYAGFLDYDIC